MRGFTALVAFGTAILTTDCLSVEPGISRGLAQARAKQIRDLRYALQISLLEGSERLTGMADIRFRLATKAGAVVLDWRGRPVTEAHLDGRPTDVRHENGHLVLPALDAGKHSIRLAFEAPVAVSGTAVTRYKDREDGAEYLYTLLVPADTSSLFPCFDQPDLKARFTLELDLPAGWSAVSNSLEESRGKFRTTEPISTYLFAFAAGPFEVLQEEGVRLYVRRSRLAKASEHAKEVLRLNREATGYFEGYFAHPFPFPKYDLVLIPEFAYGGMEHAGATFLNEERVLFPAPPSALDLLRRAQLIFHETSHQWFGDLVTMRWFDDLWLKEGFANFMAAKATEALLPHFDAWTAFHALKTSAVRTDVTKGTTAIRYPLANLADAKSAYGAIVYSKGPAVLRQAEFYLGEAVFRQAVRAFVRGHAYGAADWHDLVRAFERASGKRLGPWAQAWVQRRGAATVRAQHGLLSQRDSLGEGTVWPMKLRLLEDGALRDVFLDARPLKVKAGAFVFPNAGDYGYGRFLLDPMSLETALSPGFRAGSALLESQIDEAIWEAVRDADLDPRRFLRYALRRVPQARDDIALAGLLARIEAAFRRYLDDAQRDAIAPDVERALREPGAAGSRGLLLMRAFIALAWSAPAQDELKRLLHDPQVASRDRFRIVQRLILRGDPGARSLLAKQAAADPSDDGRRYAYAAGAADPAAKQALFRAFLDDAALPESWIEAALGALNAPEQSRWTQPLLAEALERLPALKRKHKIFFVGDWLAGFLGGQTDAAALAEVERFLQRRDIEADLRLKILEASDGLERAVRIRKKFTEKTSGAAGARE